MSSQFSVNYACWTVRWKIHIRSWSWLQPSPASSQYAKGWITPWLCGRLHSLLLADAFYCSHVSWNHFQTHWPCTWNRYRYYPNFKTIPLFWSYRKEICFIIQNVKWPETTVTRKSGRVNFQDLMCIEMEQAFGSGALRCVHWKSYG